VREEGKKQQQTTPTVLPFPECQMVGIRQYVAPEWLLSPNHMHPSFLHVFWCMDGKKEREKEPPPQIKNPA